MLLQQSSPHEADEVHVTSEELAAALTAIESRRQVQTEREIDTIALGEAIRQLGLDVTADELMAEVRAHRGAEIAAAEAIAVKRRTARRTWKAGLIAVLLVVLWFVVRIMRYQPPVATVGHPVAATTLADASRLHEACSLNLEAIYALNHGTPPSAIQLADGLRRGIWSVEFVKGQYYVRAWRGRIRGGRMPIYPLSPWLHPGDGRSISNGESGPYYQVLVPISRLKDVRDPDYADPYGQEQVWVDAE